MITDYKRWNEAFNEVLGKAIIKVPLKTQHFPNAFLKLYDLHVCNIVDYKMYRMIKSKSIDVNGIKVRKECIATRRR
jgi:hypothetical protein